MATAKSINPGVEEFLRKKNHPMDVEIRKVHDVVLQASSKIEEDIKWSSTGGY